MTPLDLTLACVPTDRSRPILDGSIAIPGVRIKSLPGEPEEIFRRALREEAFDITEMSMSSHITVTARGATAYVAIPVFLSRAFRHSGIFIRTDRGIHAPVDLKGKRIGIPEYQQTAILWIRGMLRDEHGIAVRDVEWFTGGVNEPLPGERIALTPDCAPRGCDRFVAIKPDSFHKLAIGARILAPEGPRSRAATHPRLAARGTSHRTEWAIRKAFLPSMKAGAPFPSSSHARVGWTPMRRAICHPAPT